MELMGALRNILVALRDAIDGRLHASRRRRALDKLASLTPSSILFVCLGNICRSPYAARAMVLKAGPGVRVESAGFIGPDRPPPDEALAMARHRGIDHADHRSRVLTRSMMEDADVVVVFDRFNARRLQAAPGVRPDRIVQLGDFDPLWTGKRAIIDPWGRGIDSFAVTFERIDRCLDEVQRVLSGLEGEANPRSD